MSLRELGTLHRGFWEWEVFIINKLPALGTDTLPTPKNNGHINIGSRVPNPGTSIGTRQALYTNSSVRGAYKNTKREQFDLEKSLQYSQSTQSGKMWIITSHLFNISSVAPEMNAPLCGTYSCIYNVCWHIIGIQLYSPPRWNASLLQENSVISQVFPATSLAILHCSLKLFKGQLIIWDLNFSKVFYWIPYFIAFYFIATGNFKNI